MRLTKHLLLFPLIAVFIATTFSTAAGADARRPNFVFIYADDWRWDCVGTVQREQGEIARFPWLETPRLDRLATQSVRFNQAFVVNSLCSPGRAAVLTGRYNHLNGIIGNEQPFPAESDTFAKRLQAAGYTTAYCGKWHMDGQQERPGFDFVGSFIGQGRYFDCPIMLNGRKTQTTGWVDDVSTDHAIDFIKSQKPQKPFFLFLGFKSPHGPRGGENLPERVRDLYPNEESRDTPNVGLPAIYRAEGGQEKPRTRRRADRRDESHRAYMQHITAIDECIGRVLDALDKAGQADNTIVIVTSDNGYYLGEHGLGDKRTAYEESIRVPLLVRVPGEDSRRGVTSEAMVLNIDHASTILDFAGADPLPEAQGRSLRPVLSGEAPTDWRTSYFYEYLKEGQYEAPTVLAVRTTTHKLITYPGHDEWTELYDIENDPYETQNLVSDEKLLNELRAEFDAQSQAVQFRMPENVGAAKERPNKRARRNRPDRKRQQQRGDRE